MSCEKPAGIAIKIENLGKCYQIYDKPRDRLLQMLVRGRKQFYREFWALDGISVEIKRGETVGIIGRNGSGKSTLLQLVCGTLNPSAGNIQVNGRVAALLELGSGFNPEFTGLENVYLVAALYGLTRVEVDERFDRIAAFADIGGFMDQPVKTYSSGMLLRLAFAVIAHVDADILVIDEALSVGDAYFVQKCMRFLRDFMKHGTLLFCSHDIGAVTSLCSTAILLGDGGLQMIGNPKEISERYLADLYKTSQSDTRPHAWENALAKLPETQQPDYRDMREALINTSTLRNDVEIFRFDPEQPGFGTGIAQIISVRLLDDMHVPLAWAVGGENVILEIRCKTNERLSQPIVGFNFRDRLGQVVFADNTCLVYPAGTLLVGADVELVARFDFRLPVLPSGGYSISAAIAEGSQEQHVQHHWMHDALMLNVHASSVCFGLVGIPMRKITLETR